MMYEDGDYPPNPMWDRLRAIANLINPTALSGTNGTARQVADISPQARLAANRARTDLESQNQRELSRTGALTGQGFGNVGDSTFFDAIRGGVPASGALAPQLTLPAAPEVKPVAASPAGVAMRRQKERQMGPARGALSVLPSAVGSYPELDARDAEGSSQGADALIVDPQPQAQPAPEVKRQSLVEEYRKRLAEREKPGETGVNDDQRKRALLEAGLAIMAAAGRPGASAAGAIGEGGLRGTALVREQEKVNRDEAERRRREGREDLNTEFSLMGKDRDDERADKSQASTEKHQRAVEALQAKSLEIQREYKQGLITQKEAELRIKEAQAQAAREIGIAKIEAAAARLSAAKDKEPPELALLRALQADPRLADTYRTMKGDKTGEPQLRQKYAEARLKAQSDPLQSGQSFPSFEEFKSWTTGDAATQGGTVARPKTQADYDALPRGSRYIHPKDNRERIKP